jgi:hypothetical protein
MRFIVASSLVACSLLAALWGCTVTTEAPNPPANPNGVTSSSSSSGSSLPDPSSEVDDPQQQGGSDAGKDTGSSSGQLPNGPTSGLDGTKKIGTLSSTEKKQICDWVAGINGGYGRATTCDGGLNVTNAKTQSACVSKIPPASCEATVTEFEDCMKVDAQDPCAFAILRAPECAAVKKCI